MNTNTNEIRKLIKHFENTGIPVEETYFYVYKELILSLKILSRERDELEVILS
jgi:hypothetical protein